VGAKGLRSPTTCFVFPDERVLLLDSAVPQFVCVGSLYGELVGSGPVFCVCSRCASSYTSFSP